MILLSIAIFAYTDSNFYSLYIIYKSTNLSSLQHTML